MIGADPFSQLFVVFSRQSEHRPAGLLVVEKYSREMVSEAFPLAQAEPKIPVLIVDTQGFVVPANQFPVGTLDQAGIDDGVPVEQTVLAIGRPEAGIARCGQSQVRLIDATRHTRGE